MSTPEAINPQDEDLLARALRRTQRSLSKLGDYLIALKTDDPRGKLQKEAAATMRQLADQIALVADCS